MLEKVMPELISAQHRHVSCGELTYTTHVYHSLVNWHCCGGSWSRAWRSSRCARRRRTQSYINMMFNLKHLQPLYALSDQTYINMFFNNTCNINMSLRSRLSCKGWVRQHLAQCCWVVHCQDIEWGNGPRPNFGCLFFVGEGWHNLLHVYHLCDLQVRQQSHRIRGVGVTHGNWSTCILPETTANAAKLGTVQATPS
jgi:hypothetical protein